MVFVDDSKQRGFREGMGELLALGAAIFPEEAVKPYSDGVEALFERLHVPVGVEMKWSAPKNHWYKSAPEGVRDELQSGVLELAHGLGVLTVVVIFDTGRTSLKGDAAKAWILDYLYERVSLCLADHDEVGVVIADKPSGGPRDETRWLAETNLLTTRGTAYVPAERIVMPVVTAPSDHLRHLQLADLVVGATTALVSGNNEHPKRLLPTLLQLTHRRDGVMSGVGVKLYPDSLVNLHHWVFGEQSYPKFDGGRGLPVKRYPYFESDGCTLRRADLLPEPCAYLVECC